MRIFYTLWLIFLILNQNKDKPKNLFDYDIFKFNSKSISYFRSNRLHLLNKHSILKLGFVDVNTVIETNGQWNMKLDMNFDFDNKEASSKFAILINENSYLDKFEFYNNNDLNIHDYFEGIIIYGEIKSSSKDKPSISQILINKVKSDSEFDQSKIMRNAHICKTNFFHNKRFTIKLSYLNDNLSLKYKEKTDEDFHDCGIVSFPNLKEFNFSIGGINVNKGVNLFIDSITLDNLRPSKLTARPKPEKNINDIRKYISIVNEEKKLKMLDLKNNLLSKYSSYLEITPKDLIKNLGQDISNNDYKVDYGVQILSSQAENLEKLKEYLLNFDNKMSKKEDSFLTELYEVLNDIEKSTDNDNEDIDRIFSEIEKINFEKKADSILTKTDTIFKKLKIIKEFSDMIEKSKIDNDTINNLDKKFTSINTDIRKKFVSHAENKINYIQYIVNFFFYGLTIWILIGFLYIYYKLNKPNQVKKSF